MRGWPAASSRFFQPTRQSSRLNHVKIFAYRLKSITTRVEHRALRSEAHSRVLFDTAIYFSTTLTTFGAVATEEKISIVSWAAGQGERRI